MKLNEMLIGIVIEGDVEAEDLATELLGKVKLEDLTVAQVDKLVCMYQRQMVRPKHTSVNSLDK